MNRMLITAAALICLIFTPGLLFAAPATTDVEISDRAYTDLEKIVARRLCHPPMIDQRPLSRGEFARLIAEAKKNFDTEKDPLLEPGLSDNYKSYSRKFARNRRLKEILNRLTDEFREELVDIGAIEGHVPLVRGHPLDELRIDAIAMSQAPQDIIYDNGVGTVNAVVNPFLHYREGRHAIDGFQFAVETTHRFRVTRHFAFMAHPRIEGSTERGDHGDSNISVLLQEGYGRFQVADAALRFGRSSLVWGPGERGALEITNNARPLDLIEFETPSPFRMPWVFKHLGQWRVSLFGANLGPEQVRRYAWLTGYRISLMPIKYLELGFGNTTMMGGEGTPELSIGEIIGEFIGFRIAGTAPDSPNKTNHIMEASVLIRIPEAFGLELYGVLANEDKRDTLLRFFRDGSSYLAGFYLPWIGWAGSSDFRFEFKRMSPLAYRHGLYANGFTLNNLFIGDDLGSDALGVHTRFGHDFSEKFSVSAVFDWETRRPDIHVNETEADGTLGDIEIVSSGPHEQRYRFVAEPKVQITDRLKLYAMAGYERVLNAGYADGVSRNNWLLAASLRVSLDPSLRFEAK